MNGFFFTIAAALLFAQANNAAAQAAGAGADFNKRERAVIKEQQRLERVDPPVRPDPLGNALIGGAVTGTMKGAAAGATSAIRSGAIGSGVQAAKEDIRTQKVENEKTGRGGPSDPRYNPGTLLNR